MSPLNKKPCMCDLRSEYTWYRVYTDVESSCRMWTSAQSNSFCFKYGLSKIITRLLFSSRTFGKCNLPPSKSLRIYQLLPLRNWLCTSSLLYRHLKNHLSLRLFTAAHVLPPTSQKNGKRPFKVKRSLYICSLTSEAREQQLAA